jgi:hypothetical protein
MDIDIESYARKLFARLLEEQCDGVWGGDEAAAPKYVKYLRTVYSSRALLDFYCSTDEDLAELIPANWPIHVTADYLVPDPSPYADAWIHTNSAFRVSREDIALHFKSLALHTLAQVASYLRRVDDDTRVDAIRSVASQWLAEFGDNQHEDGAIGDRTRTYFTSRKLISAFAARELISSDLTSYGRLDVPRALQFLIDGIDTSDWRIHSTDRNVVTDVEESAIALEALSLWKSGPNPKARAPVGGDTVARLADALCQAIGTSYPGSSHDLGHAVQALHHFMGPTRARKDYRFHRVFNQFWTNVQQGLFLQESPTNHPSAEICCTISNLAKYHRRITGQFYDAFISHASEDKNEFVEPLVNALTSLGLEVWYDDHNMLVGDSLLRSIDEGILRSRNGIIVLSQAFFQKPWPRYELEGLHALQTAGRLRILPVCLDATIDEVRDYNIGLATRKILNARASCVDDVARQLLVAVRKSDH